MNTIKSLNKQKNKSNYSLKGMTVKGSGSASCVVTSVVSSG